MMVPAWFWGMTAFLFGINIGSFLNVVIWRLPRGESLADPPSHCPNCNTRLRALDLIPLVSFLALGRRCRYCGKPISWRYFCIELLTGLLFAAITLRFPQQGANVIALALFGAVMVPIYFIDLATFEILNSLNLAAFCIAVGRDVSGILRHEPGHELMWGWLPRSLFGALAGVLIFGGVRLLGWLWKRQEAMGLGDVLLARAMGAMLVSVTLPGYFPLRLFPVWVMFACMSGAIVGPALIWWRRTHPAEAAGLDTAAQPNQAAAQERDTKAEQNEHAGATEPDVPDDPGFLQELGAQLVDIGWCLILGDGIEYIRDLVGALRGRPAPPEALPDMLDDEPLAPTAIPFGPFMILGFFGAVFGGEWVTQTYLAYMLNRG